MSALRSALEEWVNEDVEHLHLDQLADDLVELEHAPDYSKSNVSDGSRLLRSDPGLTTSVTHR